jgi:putative transposase
MDLCSRRIVGWALHDHMRSDLVMEAMQMALSSRKHLHPKLIFHSDRGSQYGSQAYRHLLAEHGIQQSMSAKANPYDNAWSESFIGKLKAEMLKGGCFMNREDAYSEIFAYIHTYYNTSRLHSALNYQTPSAFEQLLALAS